MIVGVTTRNMWSGLQKYNKLYIVATCWTIIDILLPTCRETWNSTGTPFHKEVLLTLHFIFKCPGEPTRQSHKWNHTQINMESWRMLTIRHQNLDFFLCEFLRKRKNMITIQNISILMFITEETLHRGSYHVQVRMSSHSMRTFSYFSNIYL
jgi:hypothetical protein